MRQVIVITLTSLYCQPVAVLMVAVLVVRYAAQAVAKRRRQRARAGPRPSREQRDDFEGRMSEHRWNLEVHGQTV